MQNECTNISIDLTNGQVVCSFSNGSEMRLPTDLFLIHDFDLINASRNRIRNAIKSRRIFSPYSRETLALSHANSLNSHNEKTLKKQKVNRTP